ncbi:uncharacterized protein LOC134527736 [Bacillus rossius redtenbacheri]|uniref:uncharacterized protein LOC134527736 n=1 Tax=Bacillus rossius redtenbacheri TaxID=93214 RepID=UPI002FDED067
MPRTYIKKIGPSQLFKYSEAAMAMAIRDVQEGVSSIRAAAEKHNVPKSTLADKVNCKHLMKHGRPTALSNDEEAELVRGLMISAECGFPLTPSNACDIVQSYLNREGKSEKQFNDNHPGREWVSQFLKRHPQLSVRLCENVKRVRAEISPEIVNAYFNHLEETLADIPPANIVNYDETNFTDDLGNERVIVRRGTRHPEHVIDTSKTSTSVMMAVAGNGTLLPPYVVYKGTYVYPTWVECGIEGSRYNSNKSGWFDMELFEDWFMTICFPYLRKLEGRKAVLGDNLASHISVQVVRVCEENDIAFILLPPNSTHWMYRSFVQ